MINISVAYQIMSMPNHDIFEFVYTKSWQFLIFFLYICDLQCNWCCINFHSIIWWEMYCCYFGWVCWGWISIIFCRASAASDAYILESPKYCNICFVIKLSWFGINLHFYTKSWHFAKWHDLVWTWFGILHISH